MPKTKSSKRDRPTKVNAVPVQTSGNSGMKGSTAPADFIIYVKTGDIKGAGCNDDLHLTLYNTDGKRSPDIKLQLDGKSWLWWKDNFEAGKIDSFPVNNLPNFGSVDKLEVWKDGEDDWYVEWIKAQIVEDAVTKEEIPFPVHRWVKKGRKLKLKKFDAQLPQDDEDADLRKVELEEKKGLYELATQQEGMMPTTKNCPPDESFANDYKWDILKTKASLRLACKLINITTDKWATLDDLCNVYNDTLPVPAGMKNWKRDREFGAQRLTGCNPALIRLCTKIPQNLPVTNEMVQPIMDGITIEEAIEKKKLYIMDLTILKDLPCSYDRKICAPLALFFVNKDQDLMPVAIQLHPDPAEDNPIYLPTDPENTWLLAKMWYNNADASYHQAGTHLGLTHLIMETVAVATHRSLSPSHPIFRLIAPHFLYLIATNTRGISKLVSEGGWVDQAMGIGRIGMFEIIKRSWKTWRLDVQGNLPNDLHDRGVADPEALPNYHYRDDAILLWDAIKRYVSDIVEAHYDSGDKVEKDFEIQEWARLLSCTSDGCGMKGVPDDGKFSTSQQLIDTVTSFIFISSVGHAAANFSQYDEYGFPPNYPAILYGTPPKDKNPVDESHILSNLPNKETTLNIMLVGKILSDRGTNGLGDFEVEYQFDPIGTKAVKTFREELKKIGGTIDARNASRTSPYPYLHPKEVPNAISI